MKYYPDKISLSVWCLIIINMVGCGQFKKTEPINIDCSKHVVIYDSFQVLLATLENDKTKLVKHKLIEPANEVVGQAIFNCKNGVLIYISEEKMKSDVKGTLNLVFDSDSFQISIENGINAIFPYGEDEILIRTQKIKKSNIDSDLGSVNSFENSMVKSASAEYNLNGKNQHIYTDDLIFDLKSRKIRKTVRGTFNPHYFHDGKFITYTSDKLAIEFFPEKGNRAILDEYQEAYINHKEKTVMLPQHGAQYIFSNKSLFLINGETPNLLMDKNSRYLPKNTIFKHVKKDGWIEIAKLKTRPIVVFLSDGKIFSIGESSVLKYDIRKSNVTTYSLPTDSINWRSASILQNKFILAGIIEANAKIYVYSDDFKEILLSEDLNNFIRPNISTMQLPLSPRQLLE